MIEVNSVEVVPDFGLFLIFSNGERRRFDMQPYLHCPVFRRLENLGFRLSWATESGHALSAAISGYP